MQYIMFVRIWQSICWSINSQLCETQSSVTFFYKIPQLVGPYPKPDTFDHILTRYLVRMYLILGLIVLFHIWVFRIKSVYIPPPAFHMPRLSNSTLFDPLLGLIFGVYNKVLSIKYSYFQASCHFLFLSSKYSIYYSVLQHLDRFPRHSTRNQR